MKTISTVVHYFMSTSPCRRRTGREEAAGEEFERRTNRRSEISWWDESFIPFKKKGFRPSGCGWLVQQEQGKIILCSCLAVLHATAITRILRTHAAQTVSSFASIFSSLVIVSKFPEIYIHLIHQRVTKGMLSSGMALFFNRITFLPYAGTEDVSVA